MSDYVNCLIIHILVIISSVKYVLDKSKDKSKNFAMNKITLHFFQVKFQQLSYGRNCQNDSMLKFQIGKYFSLMK